MSDTSSVAPSLSLPIILSGWWGLNTRPVAADRRTRLVEVTLSPALDESHESKHTANKTDQIGWGLQH